MKRNVSFASITWLVAVLALISTMTAASAAELKLAGVRLNEPVLHVLSRWGKPNGIGPLAQVTTAGGMQQGAGTVAGPRPAGGGSGMGMMGPGMMGMGMMGRQGGGVPMAGQGSAGAGMLPGMMGVGMAPPAGATPRAGQVGLLNQQRGELRGNEGVQYWLYVKPGGLRVIVGVEPAGNISTITVQGPPSTGAMTSRGIRLGSRYTEIFSAYGYPDRTRNVAGGAEVAYPDLDVRFVVNAASGVVTEITIGTPAAQPAPTPLQPAAARPGAGGMMGGPGMMGGVMGGPGMMGGMMGSGMGPGMMRRGMAGGN